MSSLTELDKNIVKDEVLKSSDHGLISSILITHNSYYSQRGYTKSDEEFFEAVYGKKPEDYLYLLYRKIPYISKSDFYEFIKRKVYYSLLEPVAVLTSSHFEKISNKLTLRLKMSGYEIAEVIKPSILKMKNYKVAEILKPKDFHGGFYGTIIAEKDYKVAIHIAPFFYNIYWGPSKRTKNEVFVFMAPVTKPEKFKDYVVVSLDNNHNIIKIVDNANEKWSSEIAEVFNFLKAEEKINIYKKKAKEVLEALVATALENLGFRVNIDEKTKANGGVDVEADVWATRGVLKVYVSCKNHSQKVGIDVIANEVGRVMQMLEAPTVKIIVASEFTEQAKKLAERNGFVPIELGFKVDEKNIIKAYNIIYGTLKKYL